MFLSDQNAFYQKDSADWEFNFVPSFSTSNLSSDKSFRYEEELCVQALQFSDKMKEGFEHDSILPNLTQT